MHMPPALPCDPAVRAVDFPLHTPFRIARGVKTHAAVVEVTLTAGPHVGRGECVPYARYGETVETVLAQIESIRPALERGLSPATLQPLLPAGAARNAVDCALWDLAARATGRPVADWLGLPPAGPVTTAWTLSVDEPAAMAEAAARASAMPLLKLKLTGAGDLDRVRAVRAARPDAVLVADANEAWDEGRLAADAPALAALGVALLEQPLPQAEDAALAGFRPPLPLCADESCHTRADLPRLAGRYGFVNVKLDKAGGLTEAAALARAAREQGFGVMLGCMISSSLSLAPAFLLSPFAAYVDLDGALWLSRDREGGLSCRDGLVSGAARGFWGDAP